MAVAHMRLSMSCSAMATSGVTLLATELVVERLVYSCQNLLFAILSQQSV